MEDNDPFASITKLCHVSSSQEEHFRRCRFAHEPHDESSSHAHDFAEIPLASTGIMMVSPPETPLGNQNDDNAPGNNDGDDVDVFQTPPEEASLASSQSQQQQPVGVEYGSDDRTVEEVRNDEETMVIDDSNCTDGSRPVDLGRGTDLGFSSGADSCVDVNQAHDKEVTHCEYMKTRVLNGELASSNTSTSSNPCLRTDAEKSLELIFKCMDKFNSPPKKLKNLRPQASRRSIGVEAEKCLTGLMKSMEKLDYSPSKRLKIFDKNLVLGASRDSLGFEIEERRGNLGKSVEELNSDGVFQYNHGLKSPQNLHIKDIFIEMNGDGGEFQGKSSAKRKLKYSTEVLELESEFEGSDAISGFNEGRVEGMSNGKQGSEVNRLCDSSKGHSARKSIDEIDKLRYVGPRSANSCAKEADVRGKRSLPASFCGKENVGEKEVGPDGIFSRKNYKEVTLLDVLRVLAKDCKHDPSLEHLSILEVAKRSGMTFP